MDSTLFPISMQKHVIFCVIGTIFFILQFARTKRWYQLVMAVAIALSLLIYAAPDSKTLFYGVGVAEAVLLAMALVLNIVQSVRIGKAEKAKKNAQKSEQTAESETEQAQPAADTEA